MAYDAIHLLLAATDSDSTTLFLREIEPHPAFPCTHATSSGEALDRLRGAAGYALFPHPYILLVDLDAPYTEVHGFLESLRHDPALRPSLVWGLAAALDSQAVLDTRDFGVTFWLQKSTAAGDCHLSSLASVAAPGCSIWARKSCTAGGGQRAVDQPGQAFLPAFFVDTPAFTF
jgi:hypothetical protein